LDTHDGTGGNYRHACKGAT